MSPSLAVLGTWLLLAAWMLALGWFAAVLSVARVGVVGAVRIALWTGASVFVLALLVVNLALPLRGPAAVWAMIGLTVGLVSLAGLLMFAKGSRLWSTATMPVWRAWLPVPYLALLALLFVVAHATFGSVSNFDSGLYHLNAVSFAAEYPTIPGLANLHDRYGTNVSLFEVAAYLQNLPWGADAFRLAVGFFMSLFVLDLSLRLLSRRVDPGTLSMLLATALMVPFLLADPGYWITSPAADTTSMLVSVVSGAFLVDALWRRDSVSGTLAVLTAALAASMRAQLWVLVVLSAGVLVFVAWRTRRTEGQDRSRVAALTWIGAGLTALLLAVQLIRDTVLSGWLIYPAGNFPVPVEWRSGDPQVAREWIQSWARTPGADPSTTLGTWDWLGPWLGRNLDDWSIRGAIGLLALALLVALVPRQREDAERPPALRTAVLATLPALATVLVWFVAAPDPRFAWGPIVSLGLIPAGVALAALPGPAIVLPIVAGVMTLSVLPPALAGIANLSSTIAPDWQSRTYEFGPIPVIAAVNPVPEPAMVDVVLDSGRVVQRPAEGDQCWTVFPLCRPTTETALQFRGADVREGFLSGR